jgi:IS5 family transposase
MRDRNAVEGGFGLAKRRYGLGLIMARLKKTAESIIALQFLVMNLEHRLRVLLCHFLCAILDAYFGASRPCASAV